MRRAGSPPERQRPNPDRSCAAKPGSSGYRSVPDLPSQALTLALAASIYPPAVAAVIALGRGRQLRSRVFAFVFAAFLITYAMGVVMLFLLEELGATTTANRSASTVIELVLGVVLIAVAVRLQRRRPGPHADPKKPRGPSKIERHLESRRLAFVLGVTLYIIPSPIYIGAAKAIADTKLSTSSELLDLAVTVAVMLWLIEVPMLLLILPGNAERVLEEINSWFARHGRTVATVASAAAGVYLSIKGLVDLVS
jgi:MFS family permease